MNRQKKVLPVFFIILLVAIVVVFIRRTPEFPSTSNGSDPVAAYRAGNNIIYSKHARCRMDCRNISEREIREVLREGVINHQKSEPERNNPRYALEDVTEDGQKVRLVIALEKTQAVVVTCIDLNKEWPCNCN
jgi:hypothetical protein